MDTDKIVESVRARFTRVALGLDAGFGAWTGNRCAERLGYGDVLDRVPTPALEAFVGVGNPAALAGLTAGERVLDVGCGGGLDAFVSAMSVAPGGSVVGVDMTRDMVWRARQAAALSGEETVSFVLAEAEDMPFGDGEFDVALSNGCLNLSPHKRELLAEVRRVLRPGGRVVLCDAVLKPEKAHEVTADPEAWSL